MLYDSNCGTVSSHTVCETEYKTIRLNIDKMRLNANKITLNINEIEVEYINKIINM